ncbi:MAG: cupin domain-containing protein [Bacteroidia bacterium]
MAYKNKVIRNPKTKQDIRFLQTARDTGGKLLEMEATYQAFSREPAPHYHPYQAEDFTVISGELTVRINGQLKVLKKGDVLHVPVNKVHSMWNNSSQQTVVNWIVQPAMDTENLLETVSGLAQDGKTNKDGMPNILQIALMMNQYHEVFRLARPSFTIQRILFMILAPFACLLGYRSTYGKYLD